MRFLKACSHCAPIAPSTTCTRTRAESEVRAAKLSATAWTAKQICRDPIYEVLLPDWGTGSQTSCLLLYCPQRQVSYCTAALQVYTAS